jgi:hypothetical protein
MDKFEDQLRKDADAIEARVTPELSARIDASIHAIAHQYPKRTRRRPDVTWWFLSSLTGAAVVLLLFVVMDKGGAPDVAPEQPAVVSAPEERTIPPLIEVPLDVRSADFTEPLAEELDNLKSDFDKAREKLGEDLKFTL